MCVYNNNSSCNNRTQHTVTVVEDESQHILITLFARGFFAYKMAQKLTIGWIFHTIIIEKRRLLRSCIFLQIYCRVSQ